VVRKDEIERCERLQKKPGASRRVNFNLRLKLRDESAERKLRASVEDGKRDLQSLIAVHSATMPLNLPLWLASSRGSVNCETKKAGIPDLCGIQACVGA